MECYDRQGNPIDLITWGRLGEDRAYRRVAHTVLGDGRVVSTVWLGVNHNWLRKDPPLIFETMVFLGEDSTEDLEIERYSTEALAIVGHDQIVARLRDEWSPRWRLRVNRRMDG